MTNSGPQNRRSDKRYYYRSGERIAWRLDKPAKRGRRGWLHNTSASGVGFIVEGSRIPTLGDNIEMRFPGFQQGIYRVVRLVKQEGGVTFVGCEQGPSQAVPESDTTPKPDTSLQRLSNERSLAA